MKLVCAMPIHIKAEAEKALKPSANNAAHCFGAIRGPPVELICLYLHHCHSALLGLAPGVFRMSLTTPMPNNSYIFCTSSTLYFSEYIFEMMRGPLFHQNAKPQGGEGLI